MIPISPKHTVAVILLLSPLTLWLLSLILPVCDDWSYLTQPLSPSIPLSELLKPNGNQWRPLDAIYGRLLWGHFSLFPFLNHLFILIAHLANTVMVGRIASRHLALDRFGTTAAILTFYLSPAIVGTVFDIDSLNQAYSQFWGLTALTLCLEWQQQRRRLLVLPVCLLFAMLSKENGMAWVAVVPMMVWAFRPAERQTARQLLAAGILTAAVYLAIRICFTQQLLATDSPYVNGSWLSHLRGVALFLSYSLLPIDYVSLTGRPPHNWALAATTLVLALPFLLTVAKGCFSGQRRTALLLAASIFLLASPHLLTFFTVMHAYSALSMVALLIGWSVSGNLHARWAHWVFALYLLAMLVTDGHHLTSRIEAGRTGQQMAQRAVAASPHKPQQVLVLIMEDNSPKYSCFQPRLSDTFGWGRAVWRETDYQWPEHLTDETISSRNDAERFDLGSYDGVWLVEKDQIEVIK